MKALFSPLSVFLFITAAIPLAGQTNIFPNSGSVGIGTLGPLVKLDVRGDALFTLGAGQSLGLNGVGSDSIVQGPNLYFTDTSTAGAATVLQQGANGGFGVWTYNSGWIERLHLTKTGNVGVGTANPQAKLQVGSWNLIKDGAWSPPVAPNAVSVGERIVFYEGGGWKTAIGMDGQNGIWFQTHTPAGQVAYQWFTGGVSAVPTEKMRIMDSGNVGIGTTNPIYKLDINSPSSRIAANEFGGVTFEKQAYPNQGALLFSSDRTGYTFFIGNKRAADNSVLPIIAMYDTGNVGIGTTTPTHKLAVNGAIRAKEVIVDTGWSDYVFADDYRLAPLAEVESRIKAERHLPGIPSAAEVAEHGVSMGEMQSKLLAKIEELTLHVIAQEKRISMQQDEISVLRSHLNQLSNVQ